MFFRSPIDHALSHLKKNVRARLRLVLWDGREVALCESPPVTVRFKDARAAAAFRRPSLLALAEAYIEGDADLEGDVREAIRGAEALARAQDAAMFATRDVVRHTRRDDKEAVATTTTSPTSSTRCGSTRAWSIRAPISAPRVTASRRHRRRSWTTSAPS